ncbi:MAG: 4-hydroxy-3-methylbut-2-enyl diphosphate reductase [Crocinitomicaceae bacterium]|nr:4-hydroxy-3-methylbut-2-enyl diphosphate reductase [Crocinitomicaceae bacterium]
MKKFDIPEFYKSPIISNIKSKRKILDPRKKDYSPTSLEFENVTFLISRHFGFCYGVENAIEIAYKAIDENPGKNIFLLSQMIHNPNVNDDLTEKGIKFIQDTHGNELIDINTLTKDDVILIPAFGASVEMEKKLLNIGVDIKKYNTTCPFVEKVWKRSEKLGSSNHSIIIHGKSKHEETRATFSRSHQNAPTLIIKDINDAKILGEIILDDKNKQDFYTVFEGRYSKDFDIKTDLNKIGVVNQTTMLATETQEISDYLKNIMLQKYGANDLPNHIADTRDTLCYATNDNQSSTIGLMKNKIDMSIVVGGYNSSNTTHLVELLEQKSTTFFIKDDTEIISNHEINHFDIHSKSIKTIKPYLPSKSKPVIAFTSGASCPDSIMDKVIHRFLEIFEIENQIDKAIENALK